MSAPSPQLCRVAFKGWSPEQQRKWLRGILEEHAYYAAFFGEPALDIDEPALRDKLRVCAAEGARHRVDALGPKWRDIYLANLDAKLAFLRETFFRDGAEGETVHAVCDAVDDMRKMCGEAADLIAPTNDPRKELLARLRAAEGGEKP